MGPHAILTAPVNDELSRLGAELSEILRKIAELTEGGVDSIAVGDGRHILLPVAQAELQRAEAQQAAHARERAAILNALPAHIALLDTDGRIVSVNESWQRFAAANAMDSGTDGVGQNYLEVCETATGACSACAREAAAGIRSVLRGESAAFELEYPCHAPGILRWFRLMVSPIDSERPAGVVVMHVDVTARVMAEETLRQSEGRYRTLLECLPENVLLKDRDLRFVSANDRFVAELGISQEALAGKRDIDFFPADLSAKYEADDRRILRTGHAEEFDERYLRNGEEIWIHTSKTPVINNFGETTGILVVFRDVSNEKRAEASLNLLRSLLNYASDSLEVFDPDSGRFLDANTAAHTNLGYSKEELLNLTVFDISPYQTEENFRALVRDLLHVASQTIQVLHRRKDGSEFPVEKSITLVTLDRPYLVCSVRDITERQRTEAQLHLQASVLEATANPIVVTDRNGTVEWVNPAFSAFTGYSLEEALGKNPRDLVRSGFHDKAFYTNMWETIQAGLVWQGELTNRHKDGTLYTEFQTITPIREISGEISHFVGVKLDISERKRLEEELFQAQKMESVGRLAGGVAHDFNNLLTVISGYTEMVLGAVEEDGHLHADLVQVKKAADRAASLTRQLLAFSRKQVLRPEVLDLNHVILDCTKMLQRLIGEDIALVVKPGMDLWPVLADPGQLEQIMMNLVVNSRDAMPQGGSVIVETGNQSLEQIVRSHHAELHPGEYVSLVVSDTGTGMDEATREKVFEPFFTTKAFGKGTGLGLATVYGIVKQSGGSIFVYSEVGRGTTFKIFLPRADAAIDSAHIASQQSMLRGTETILLVEDEEALRLLTERILTQAGYTVLVASNGKAALALVEQQKETIQMILTDVVMPVMGGRELVEHLRVEHPDLKVLFMSGYTDAAIAVHGVLEPGVHLLGKPFSAGQLTSRIRAVLDGGG